MGSDGTSIFHRMLDLGMQPEIWISKWEKAQIIEKKMAGQALMISPLGQNNLRMR